MSKFCPYHIDRKYQCTQRLEQEQHNKYVNQTDYRTNRIYTEQYPQYDINQTK